MCGRYTLTLPLDALLGAFDLDGVHAEHEPRYNVAPTQEAPVIVVSEDGGRHLDAFRWGLVPFWADDPSIGNRMINARSETVAEKPAFRVAFRRRRCLVPADGFYEWKEEGDGKVPHWIHAPDRSPLTFAGLWEQWEGAAEEDGTPELVRSFTILTTDAGPALEEIHPRMPVILDPDARKTWLEDGASREALEALLGPYPDDELEAYPVSRIVNSPANDVPECVEPVGDGEAA